MPPIRCTTPCCTIIVALIGMMQLMLGCGIDTINSGWSLHDDLPTPSAQADQEPLANCGGTLPDRSLLLSDSANSVRHSLALDASGCPHVTLCRFNSDDPNNPLYYAQWDGEVWNTELVAQVEGNGCWANGLTIDADGRPSVAYVGPGRTSLMYARRDEAGEWLSEKVADITPFGIYHAIDPSGVAVIATLASATQYELTDSRLVYFRRDASGWQREDVFTRGEAQVLTDAFTFDTRGRLHLAAASFELDARVLYAFRTDANSWSRETIELDDSTARTVSIALDASDQPHLVYSDSGSGSGPTVIHLFRTESGWQTEAIDAIDRPQFRCGGLAFDADNRLHALYGQRLPPWPNGLMRTELRHAAWDGQAWTVQRLGEFRCDRVSLEVDARTGVGHVVSTIDEDVESSNTPVYFTFPLDPVQ